MLPLTALLALHTAHAQDQISVVGAGSLRAALAQVDEAGDEVVVDTFVTGEGRLEINRNPDFIIRGQTDCGDDPLAPCAFGWGGGTQVVITGNSGPGTVEIYDITLSGNADVTDLTDPTEFPDGESDAPLRIVDKNADLERVWIQGSVNDVTTPDRGAGLTYISGPDTEIVMNQVFVQGNTGPAVSIFGGDATITESLFSANGDDDVGFGTFLDDQLELFAGAGLRFNGDRIELGFDSTLPSPITDPVIKRGNNFRENSAAYGGGAYIKANEGFIAGNRFEYNVGNDYSRYNEFFELNSTSGVGVGFAGRGLGGGLYVGESGITDTLEIKWNTFASNWGWDGAGVHLQNPEDVVFENNVVAQNWAVHIGGGLSIIHDDYQSQSRPRINNNTLVGNLAGLTRVLLAIQVVGGGGNARIEGLIPEFKNNVISHAPYGGGILGKIGDGPFEAGDDFNTWFRYNMFYWNCDVFLCEPNGIGDKYLTGNYDQYSLHPTNIVETEPEYIYFGDPREGGVISDNDAYPDEFCLDAFSIGVGAGDPDLPNLDDSSYASDVGHCGGVQCFYWNRDRDGDGWLQHQDCLDDPDADSRDPGAPPADMINPDMDEDCDYLDNNCNGVIDETFDNKWWFDADGDGGGAFNDPGILACDIGDLPDGGQGYVPNNDDCDDDNVAKNGGGALAEVCDEWDNDCDGFLNEEEDGTVNASLQYPDVDGDLFGASKSNPVLVCSAVSGGAEIFYLATPDGEEEEFLVEPLPPEAYRYYEFGEDCNDNEATINPNAVEICDDIDQNCNGDAYDVADGELFYLDTDGDGWGDITTVVAVCDGQPLPDGNYVPNGGDCDETNILVNNGADESCDVIDNDCNGIVDDNPVDGVLLYEDFDNDGFGNPATALRACSGSHGASYTASVGGDCDDNDAGVGECSDCGCQAAPTSGSVGLLGSGLLALFGLRRRR